MRKCLEEIPIGFLTRLYGSEKIPSGAKVHWYRFSRTNAIVPRGEVWYCTRKSGVTEKCLRAVQYVYEGSETGEMCARSERGLQSRGRITPRFGFESFWFAMVMDWMTDAIRQESLWPMMPVDDIVSCSERRQQSNRDYSEEVKQKVQARCKSRPLTKRREAELETTEPKMLRFSSGVTRTDEISNACIRETAKVGRLGGKVREARLEWFGRFLRSDVHFLGRRMLRMELPGKRKRGRTKGRLMDVG
ncbi:uncharacterized protein LOC119595266 [Penaeus monodon]|uniref:uncharacterized protein LOC119595266 n=1 Tax=Penaeus monodon TaxID=6687 RepID=UPI0018A71820|nr:uncharacterized protein LOC119595266 [Penaeus monodon]